MTSRPGMRSTASTVLSVVLMVAIAGAAFLLALQIRSDAPIRFAWGDPSGVDCPQGVGAPACFQFIVTNVGNRPAQLHCEVSASEGARSFFLNGSTIYESVIPVEPAGGLELTVKVDAGPGGTAPAPTMSCIDV